jgi:hypothetical protein
VVKYASMWHAGRLVRRMLRLDDVELPLSSLDRLAPQLTRWRLFWVYRAEVELIDVRTNGLLRVELWRVRWWSWRTSHIAYVLESDLHLKNCWFERVEPFADYGEARMSLARIMAEVPQQLRALQ